MVKGCLAAIGGITLLGFLFIGCAVFAIVQSPDQPSRADLATVVPVGRTVVSNGWGIEVIRVEQLTSLPENAREIVPQGKYVVVYLTLRNDGKRQNRVGYSSFVLYDSAGREYEVAQAAPGRSLTNPTLRAAENAGLKPFTTDLLPSLRFDTALAFDVVPNAVGLHLGGPTLGKTRIYLGQ